MAGGGRTRPAPVVGAPWRAVLDVEGIGIPYPQRDVHLHIQDDAVKRMLASPAEAKVASGGANPQPYELDEDRDGDSEG